MPRPPGAAPTPERPIAVYESTRTWRGSYDLALGRGTDALTDIRDGDRVFVSGGCAEPAAIVDALVGRARTGALPPCELYMMFGGTSGRLAEIAGPRHRVVSITATPSSGSEFFPWTIHQTARLLAADDLRFDVALLHTSEPDERGRASLGISVDFAHDAFRQARTVVAEVNRRMPRTAGDNTVDARRFDGAVAVDRALRERRSPEPSTRSQEIARHVAALIPDGATVEFGVGRVMADVVRALAGHHDLGLHTGLLTDEMVELIDAGVITGLRKPSFAGVAIANQVRGTERLYRYLDDNPRVQIVPARYTHDPAVLHALPDFHAVNSALQVDLMGRVNGEFRGGERVSSTGGLGDFVRAAVQCPGGHSIIALGATESSGRSRIVAALPSPDAVTLTADLADVVVTEFGVAHLRGRTPRERAAALIEIAHPDHRDSLI
jgi:4-hydroxybutyrate CoA-transferase